MPRYIAPIIAACALLVSFQPGWLNAADKPSVKAQLEDLAALLPCFDTGDLLWDRLPNISPGWIGVADEAPYRRGVAELMALQASEADLLPLLKHPDPKVRTLAMARLFMNEDPKALPAIVALAHDTAPTFPNPQPTPAVLATSGLGPPPKDQTESSIAMAIVDFYLERAGFGYGIDGHGDGTGFAAYWKPRKSRDYCTSWFLVDLARATQGTAPIRADRVDAIRRVRARIDQVPEPDRSWILLTLGRSWREDPNDPDPLANVFITDEEMVRIGQRLGPKDLLLALQGHIPCDDPDLQPNVVANPGEVAASGAMNNFILHHAAQLLRPQDADALLALGHSRSAWLAIAAARLRPDRATEILKDELWHFHDPAVDNLGYDQADLGVTLWQMAGAAEADFLADWFYNDLCQKNGHICPDACYHFIDGVADTPSARKLLAKIVADPRYKIMSAYATIRLANAVNRWVAKPIVTDDEIRNLYGNPPQELVTGLLDRLHQSVPSWQK